jgi:hypothetical protein
MGKQVKSRGQQGETGDSMGGERIAATPTTQTTAKWAETISEKKR